MPRDWQLLVGILTLISGAVILLQSARDPDAPESKEFIPSTFSRKTRRFAAIGALIVGTLLIVAWYFRL